MERHKDHRQRIYFFTPDLEKHPVIKYWSDILWMENLEVSVWPHSMWGLRRHHAVYTHSHGVSVVVGRTKVSIPTKHHFLGNDSSDHVIHYVWLTKSWFFVLYTCSVFLKSLEEIWYKHTSAKFFFACWSVLNIEPFLYGCVFVYMLMSAFLIPTW